MGWRLVSIVWRHPAGSVQTDWSQNVPKQKSYKQVSYTAIAVEMQLVVFFSGLMDFVLLQHVGM